MSTAMLSRRSQITSCLYFCPFHMKTERKCQNTPNMYIIGLKLKLRTKWVHPCCVDGQNTHHFDVAVHFLWKQAQIEAENKISTPMVSRRFQFTSFWWWCPISMKTGKQMSKKTQYGHSWAQIEAENEISILMLSRKTQFLSCWCWCPFTMKTGNQM